MAAVKSAYPYPYPYPNPYPNPNPNPNPKLTRQAVLKIDGVMAETILHVAAKQYNAGSHGALQQALSRADPLFARLLVAGDGDARELD